MIKVKQVVIIKKTMKQVMTIMIMIIIVIVMIIIKNVLNEMIVIMKE